MKDETIREINDRVLRARIRDSKAGLSYWVVSLLGDHPNISEETIQSSIEYWNRQLEQAEAELKRRKEWTQN